MRDWVFRTTRKPTSPHSGPSTGIGPPCRPGSICGGLLALVVVATACQSQEPDPLSQQRSALEALYDATSGGDWNSSANWLSDRPLDDWYGVSTNANGYVDSINLNGNGLSGRIPAELGEPDSLEHLDLGGNVVYDADWNTVNDLSSIPAELGNLGSLEHLDLTYTDLSGSLPDELGNLGSLEWLSLRRTGFSGAIPAWLGNLGSSLEHLDLSGVKSFAGPIPAELGNLGNLRNLDLSITGISAPIPAELGNLANLERLSLEGTDVSGPIPAELGNLANLEWLGFAHSRALVGPLPTELVQIQNLRVLEFDRTGLCAPTDQSFQDWLAGLARWRGDLCD